LPLVTTCVTIGHNRKSELTQEENIMWFDENRSSDAYLGTFSTQKATAADEIAYDLICKQVAQRNKYMRNTKWVVRRRYRGPRAHRTYDGKYGQQSMCHKADATRFDVYAYEERV